MFRCWGATLSMDRYYIFERDVNSTADLSVVHTQWTTIAWCNTRSDHVYHETNNACSFTVRVRTMGRPAVQCAFQRDSVQLARCSIIYHHTLLKPEGRSGG